MRKLAFLLLLVMTSLPASAAKRVTVTQLESLLLEVRAKPDAEVARQLSNLELTERVSASRLSQWSALPLGSATRSALMVLADTSTFLDPPASEIPATAAPDLPAQRQMFALVADYVSKAVHQLPNFFATRATTRFEDSAQENIQGEPMFGSSIYRPLHPVGTSRTPMVYRDGREVQDVADRQHKKPQRALPGLTSWGEFGPILGTVLLDAAQSTLTWSRWEQGAAGQQAVFRYAVPKAKSHYEVQYCCIPSTGSAESRFVAYHGEMAIDPATGTILRLTVQADLRLEDPVSKADMMVEYGSVEIGGKTYTCPVKSVALSRAWPERLVGVGNVPEAPKTYLNDVVFENYHVYRATAKIVAP